jgi:DNA-binding XRE family transcriptional regulator
MTSIVIHINDNLDADRIIRAIKDAGLDVLEVSDWDETFTFDEVLAEAYPAKSAAEIAGICLKTAREEKNLTQAQLAAQIGITKQAISAIENGKRSISKAMAEKFEHALSVPYKAFL